MAAINFTQFFTSLGKLGKALNGLNVMRGTTIPGYASALPTQVDFQAYPAVCSEAVDTLNQFAGGSQFQSVAQGLNSAADDLLLSVVNAYTGDTSNTDVGSAIAILVAAGAAELSSLQGPISQNTVSSSFATLAGNAGNGTAVCSLFRDDGSTLQFPLAETMSVLCTSDSVLGRATRGEETFTITGMAAQRDKLAATYPQGSGVSLTLNSCDATSYNAGNNLTTNGNFELWTGNTPQQWSIVTGTAGTEIAKYTALVYDGTGCAQLIGGTGIGLVLDQLFGDAVNGTAGTLLPCTQYAFNVYMRKVGTPSGFVDISLVDKTTGATIIDFTGQSNDAQLQVSTLSSSLWSAVQGFFITPKSLPASYALRIKCSGLTAGSVLVDHFGLAPMVELYPNGPQVAVFSGSAAWSQANGGDGFNLTVSNNYASTWCTMLQRLYDLNGKRLIMGHASSPSISDSLLT